MSSTPASASSSSAQTVPPELQQWVLNIFRIGCSDIFDDSLSTTIQEIKKHLFERDFTAAFSKPEYLEAYAARWSPTRALCYFEILLGLRVIEERLRGSSRNLGVDDGLAEAGEQLSIDDTNLGSAASSLPHPRSARPTPSRKGEKIVFLGAGGGAELAAFAGCLRQIGRRSQGLSDVRLDCVFVDAAEWSPLLSKLYSSAGTSDLDASLNQNVGTNVATPLPFSMNIQQQDVLKATQGDLATAVGDAGLVTLMFTLNELYSTSLGSTTKMLLHLTSIMERGALLLVVDSPGSYSTVNMGNLPHEESESTGSTEPGTTQKRYRMQWLLDHTLLENATVIDSENGSHKQWTKLESEESKWFRLPRLKKLQYPLELEDMRYQMHLYQHM